MRLLKYMLPLLALLIWSATVSADYDPTSPPEPGVNFTLTTRCVPEGAAKFITPSATHAFESSVKLSTQGNTNFTFVSWVTTDDVVVSENPDFTYTMPAKDVELIAKYVYAPSDPAEPGTPEFKETATLRFSKTHADAGSIYYYGDGSSYSNPTEVIAEVGTEVRLNVIINPNYNFIGWTCDGVVIGETTPFNYTVESGTHDIVANFEYNPNNPVEPGENMFVRTLTVKANPEDAASVYGSGTYNFNESVHVYDYVNKYYTFINWTDDLGEVVSTSRSFYYTIPNREVTLTANYSYDYNPDSPEEPGVPVPPGSIAENMVAYPRFGMYDDTHVMILCETEGSTIYYTLDGSDPTEDSDVYTEPVFVPSNLVVKAIAFKEGMDHSPIRSFQVSAYRAAAPKFTFVNRKIEITSDTPGALIFYTLDFTEPSTDGPRYTEPIEPEENCRIKAIASSPGLTDSEVSIFVYRRADYTLDAPTFSLNAEGQLVITPPVDGGETYYTYTSEGEDPTTASTRYTGPVTLDGNGIIRAFTSHINYFDSPVSEYVAEGFVVATPTVSFTNPLLTLTTDTRGAQIRYTTDGSIPTEESSLYGEPIRLTADCVVTARGFKANYEPSETTSFSYVYNDYVLPTPTASFANKQLTLTCTDAEASIYYTTDGSTATVSSTLYEGPVALTQDCTVKFIASREHFNDSPEGTFNFVRSYYAVATPVFNYDREAATITIATTTENAEIRYTTDGTVPESNTGTVYSAPINVTSNETLTARAFRNDMFDSEAATLVVDNMKVPTPVASFANKVLTLTCPDSQAQIRYTTDGTEPSATSTLYEAPLSLTADCTVRFIAIRENFNNSDVADFRFEYAAYCVATPTFNYDTANNTVTIACATADAEIRYTTDGSEPTSASALYSNPVGVTGNMTIRARAFRSDLFDSEIATLAINDLKVATPTATFANKQLTLSCSDNQAQIRYTTDGSAPTATSTLYEGPINLTTDCTVRFIAVRENYNNSDEGSFNFVVTQFTVATPTITYNRDNGTVTIACATPDAVIRYTTNGTVPSATTGTVYSGPVTIENNLTVTARAFKDDLFDSETVTYVVDDKKLPTPTATYAAHAVTLSCEDGQAAIRYTTDGSAPTATSTLYSAPVQVTNDVTLRFIAVRPNFNNSDVASYQFKLADYKEEKPVVAKDHRNRKLTVTQSASTSVSVTIGTSTTNHNTPATLDVTPGTTQVSVVALASNADRFDSDATVESIVFHHTPVISFNGRTVTVSHNPADPNATGVKRNVTFNGVTMSNDEENVIFDVEEFGSITAYVESDAAFYSEPAAYSVDFFNTGTITGARNGHSISEAFGGHGDSLSDYEELTVVGEIGGGDMKFLASLPALTTVTLNPTSFNSGSFDGVLAGAHIETITLPSLPEGMLKSMPRLTSVVWASTSAMPEGRLSEAGNPNLLLWVNDRELAPADASNVVVNGNAGKITLHPGYPFNAFQPFDAESVELTKSFTLPTEIGVCQGWETLALPFAPERIYHESKGDVVPYTAWDGSDESAKPFWLYKASATGWDEAAEIEPGTPYIISMPNNPEYIEAFNLNGKITFTAENVTLGSESALPKSDTWVEGMNFEATFMPVGNNVLSLNSRSAAGGADLPGSVFTSEATTLPFEAYVAGSVNRKRVAVFGDWSNISLPTLSPAGVIVEPLGGGKVRISSGREFTAEIYTLTGMKVRSAHLTPGKSVTIDGLAKGIYIVAGSKISIN